MKKNENKNPNSCSTKKQEKLREQELDDCFFASNCASARDCTGTVVRGPQSSGVAEAYNEVYHYKPQVPDELKRK